jgi:hypothetical protein
MSEVDLNTLPPLLPADVQRTFANGLPTEALMDSEQYGQNWMKTNVVALDTKLTTVSATVDDQTGSITELTAVVQNDDGTLTAGKLTDVKTTTDANTAEITDLTVSVGGIAVQKVVKATLNGSTGYYELTGVQNADGTGPFFTFALNVNQFLLTDPSYNGGLPGNVFAYYGGVFRFNVPVQVVTGDLAANAVTDSASVAAYTAGDISISINVEAGSDLDITATVTNTAASFDIAGLGTTYVAREYRIFANGLNIGTLQTADMLTGYIFNGGVSYSYYKAISPASLLIPIKNAPGGVYTITMQNLPGRLVNLALQAVKRKR